MGNMLNSGPNHFFRSALLRANSNGCLVLGAGSEVELVNEYCDNIIGINVSRATLQRIKRFNANLILGDAQRLPLKDSCVDLVICKSALHHFSNLNTSLLEIKRVTVHGSYVFLYEPGLLNMIAFFGRKIFPTDIHEPSEKPFILSSLRRLLDKHFDILNEKEFFVFVHSIPILEKAFKIKVYSSLLRWLLRFDELLCRTYFKNFCWVMTFTLRKKMSFASAN